MDDNSSLTFLPRLFNGINAMPPGVTTASHHRTVNVEVSVVDEHGAPAATVAPRQVVLKGPGEIIAFSPRMIGRVEPKPGENAFESNYFPCIEFIDPDFPWRYSIDPGTDLKLIPWLMLIVLRPDEYKRGPSQGTKLPTIEVAAQLLPDPADSWAWAHVQIAQGMDVSLGKSQFEDAVKSINDTKPELTCARLMCPRRLEAQTAYTAFVVPVYKMGVDAALGREVVSSEDFAWDFAGSTDASVELPVYYRWDFQTAEAGDMEELLSRLDCRDAGGNFVGRRVDASRPGYFMKNGKEEEFRTRHGRRLSSDNFLLDGALVPPGFMENGRDPLPNNAFTAEIAKSLNDALHTPMLDSQGDEDPLVSLPVYGRYFKKTKVIRRPAPRFRNANWVSEINLDRRLRVAASAGTAVVKEKQEEYVSRCWEQVGEIREANSLLRFGAAAASSGTSIKERHLDPLGDFRFVMATRPYHHYYIRPGGKFSLKAEVAASGLPGGLLSQTFKRIIAGKMGISLLDGESVCGDWLTRGNDKKRTPDTDYDFMIELMGLCNNEWPAHFRGHYGPSIPPLKPRIIDVFCVDIGGTLRTRIDSTTDILERLNNLITLPGWTRQLENLDPIMAAPTIDAPMYRRLADRSLETLSPGLGGIPPNTVLLMEENRKFIEAYLVGLNHEMNRELLWREYPADQRGTIFKYFWDPARIDHPEPDIVPISGWNKKLGGNRGAANFNDVVLVIKGDLVRRYPDTIIFAVSTKIDESVWDWNTIYALLQKQGANAEYATFRPVFSAHTGTDVLFLGFPFSVDEAKKGGYYFIMMQHPTLPRFGLNLSHVEDEADYSGWGSLSWEDVPLYPVKAGGMLYTDRGAWIDTEWSAGNNKTKPSDADYPVWGNDSAAMAHITFQDPVRMVIPAAIFLAPVQEIVPATPHIRRPLP